MINNENFYKYEEFDIKICIITFDDQVHFYPININKSSEQNISMLSINEISNELFLPTNKDYLLVDLKKYKNTFIQIIENIQNIINSGNAGNIKDSNRFFDVIKICNIIGDKKGGKILIFSGSNVSGIPIMNGLKNCDESINPKYLITDGGQIGRLGINISLNGLSVNIFESCSNDTNIRTLNQLITNSNGNLFFYRNFNSDLHYKNLYNQIRKILTNQNVLEAGLKFRFSQKFKIKEYITPVLLYNKEIIYFPNLDSDQNYSFLLSKMEENDSPEKPIDDDFLFIQASLAYTSGDGKRKVRVYNICLPFSSRAKDIYESINPEMLSSYLTQYLIMNIYRKKNLIEAVNMVEKKYNEVNDLYFNNLNLSKKELSEEMKLFCLYFLGIMKNKLFNKNERGFNNDNDLTTFFRTRIQKTKFEDIICFIYPRIYLIDNILDLDSEFPLIINNNKESMDTQGSIFLVDDGFQLTLYLKNNVDKNILYNLFGVNSFNELNLDIINESNVFDYNENKNEFNNKLIEVIDNIRSGKALFQNLQIIFEGINDKNGTIINDFLIEDNLNKSFPYDYEKFYHKIIFK
jgi:protein transport protein SEC24